jgi:predicted phage-related endonuclease
LIGGYDLRHFVIERDEAMIKNIEQRACHFWNEHVLKQIPPPPINNADLKHLYPNDTGEAVTATAQIAELIDELKAAKATANESTTLVESLEIKLKNFIGSNSALIDSTGKTLATWKAQTTNRIDSTLLKEEQPDIAAQYTKASESRVLRLKL